MKKNKERAKYLTAINRNRLMQHVAALRELRKEVSEHEEQLIRVAYKPRVTNRDLGKVYSALNSLAAISNDCEREACYSSLRRLGLKTRGEL